jgi:hypothetical protein
MMYNDTDPPEAHWRLDKRIPIALVIVLVGQFAAGVAAFTKVQADVAFIREHITDLRSRVTNVDERASEVESIKVELRYLNENVTRLRGTVDRLLEERFANRRQPELYAPEIGNPGKK